MALEDGFKYFGRNLAYCFETVNVDCIIVHKGFFSVLSRTIP